MRIDRLNQLADALKNGLPGVKFDVADWLEIRGCGTTACVAGHAIILAGLAGSPEAIEDLPRFSTTAQEWLELDDEDANELFYGGIGVLATAPMAARVVRRLAQTGEVDWSVARKEGDGE